jgi:hypothetical protein
VVSAADLRASLGEAMQGGAPLAMADQLCRACIRLLGVDGASISVMLDGPSHGTFGSSGEVSRQLDEFQFTFGEGPCLDAVRRAAPVLIEDLQDPRERRWPAYAEAVLGLGVRAIYALPISVANTYIGALDLYRNQPGPLLGNSLLGALMAAELAELPLLDLIAEATEWTTAAQEVGAWDQLGSLARVEVYQATGMVMTQLSLGPVDALARIRAHAFAEGLTANQVAWAIVERRLSFASGADPHSPNRDRW